MTNYIARQDCRSFRNTGIFDGSNPDPQGNQNQWGIYCDGYRVALIEEPHSGRTQEQVDLQARLFATAEELYNVVAWLVGEREAGTDKGLLPDGLLNSARAALAKVDGNKSGN